MSQKPPSGDRIAKVIARAGVASRREAERMIELGRVSVNGKVIDRAALNVTPADIIVVDGKTLGAPEPARLWLYHKPSGLVTTNRDEQGRPTIYDDLPADMPRVMSVGRLDLNSEGLLLLTNDGALKRQLELPSTGWLRKYRVRVNGRPTDASLEPLRQGITIDGEQFQGMIVTIDRQQGANAWLTVGIREGRNREVRRAMEAVGLSVNRLIRVSYGPFQLGPLKPGTTEEVRRRVLRDQLGLTTEAEDAPAGKSAGKPASEKPKVTRSRKPGAPPARRPAAAPFESDPAARAPRPARNLKNNPKSDRPAATDKPGGKPKRKTWSKPAGKPAARPTGKSNPPPRGPKR